MEPGTSHDTIKELVWATMSARLPAQIVPTITVLGISRYPSEDQFKIIDEIYNHHKASHFVYAAKEMPSAKSDCEKRLDKLEEKIDKLMQITSRPKPNMSFYPKRYQSNISNSTIRQNKILLLPFEFRVESHRHHVSGMPQVIITQII